MLTIPQLFIRLSETYPKHVFDLQTFNFLTRKSLLVHTYSLFHKLVDVILSGYV
jgi:hypothetical protein